jgi:hypothetical protein
MIKTSRIPFLMLAFLCLLTGLWTGLTRLGWELTPLPSTLHHGAIMVGGFIGTLILLEKIIPLKIQSLYILPVLSAASSLLFSLGQPMIAIASLSLASLGLALTFLLYLKKERGPVQYMMLIGSVCWLAGNIQLFVKPFYPRVIPWWIGFALFIIIAERLELMKFLPVSRLAKTILYALLVLLSIGVANSFHGPGGIVYGAALIGISIWSMRFDIIGITILKTKLTRYIAVALLLSYFSLLLSGIFIIVSPTTNWLSYDTTIHTFFIGFVLSMIFAHGPVIIPGVLGISFKPYHKLFYLWLTLLHISWITRVQANFLLDLDLRKLSGVISLIAILGYLITIATLVIRSKNEKV